MKIGITERGDAALDLSWVKWVKDHKPAILITKNPEKLYEILASPELCVQNIIIHCTITGYGASILEPNVLPWQRSIQAVYDLYSQFGPNRIVLRVDPIIPTDKGIDLAKKVMNVVDGLTIRKRISFIDNYDHVKERFKKANISLPWDSFHAPLDLRLKVWKELGEPEVCGEPGMKCTGCISKLDCETLNVVPIEVDKGQRPYCACLMNKKELLDSRRRCEHACLYCYWHD